jgi:hypothetical protein
MDHGGWLIYSLMTHSECSELVDQTIVLVLENRLNERV